MTVFLFFVRVFVVLLDAIYGQREVGTAFLYSASLFNMATDDIYWSIKALRVKGASGVVPLYRST